MQTTIYNSLILFFTTLNLFSQDLVFNHGGAENNGIYETRSLNKFHGVAWKTELKGNGNEDCIIHDGVIYTTSRVYNRDTKMHRSFIYAINANNGKIQWRDSLTGRVSTPSMKDSILYYGVDELEGKQYAINKHSGEVIWSFPSRYAACWQPAIAGDKNYFGSHGDRWYVINNISGELLLKDTLVGGLCCRPAIVDTMLYFVDRTGILHAYNTNTDKDMWRFDSEARSNNAPAIHKGKAYMINQSGVIFAIDLKTGKKIWSYKTGDSMFRSPAVKDNVATVITTNGLIFALDSETGNIKWQHKKEGLGYTNTSIVGNIVYVGCADNYLYAFELETGNEIWKFKSDSKVNTPLIEDGIVYFTSGKYLYAIE